MTTASDGHSDAARVLRERANVVAETLVTRQFEREPDLEARYGSIGRQKCLEDAKYHLSYLAEAVEAESTELFIEYLRWVKVMLGQRNVPAADLIRHVELMREVLVETIPQPSVLLAVDVIDAALGAIPAAPVDTPTFLQSDAPLGPLAQEYLALLLNGERHLASRRIVDAAAAGTAVRDIYLHVFQRAQYEIGRRWQMNEITVAQEHYCTAATQLIMSQLYHYIFAGEKRRGTFVGTCVAGDLHEIGVRMVADFLEMDGWRTFYLGANTPSVSVVQTVCDRRANVLGISVTMSYHLGVVSDLIRRVRAERKCGGVKILVGGYPFAIAPALWRKIGADGCARNAEEAIVLANELASDNTPA